MEDLRIVLAKETDIPFMLELWRNTPGIAVGAGDDETSIAAFIQRNPSTCLLMKSGDTIIGTVLGGFDGRRGYIYHLAVHSDYRRRGYGRKLLQEVVAKLEVLKAGKIHLFVLKSNEEAILFYEKQDWIKRHDIEAFSFNTPK
jgi:ribosomal protein S18 acetylase RimI-like enzyme